MKRLLILFIVLSVSCGTAFSQKKDSYKVRTVVIDPGHGGAKPGAQGGRSQEKNITLAVAKKFGKLITDNYPDVKVIYTRTTDVDISLAERAHIANRNKADLFISIHANSHPTSSPTGVETFVMGLSESRANLEVAKKENADILLEDGYKTNKDYNGFDPNSEESYIIFSMVQNVFLERSLNFAQAIQKQYKQHLKTINRGVKQAELYVLYKTTCPSVLTEIGFISNPSEEAFMISEEGQAKIAICLFNAFMTYKSTEDGSNKITNPVINIQGAPASQKATEQPQKPQPDVVAEAAPEPAPQPAETPKAETPKEPVATPEPVATKPEPTPAPATTTPKAKPTPTTTLPPQQAPSETKAESKPEPQQEPKVEPKPEPSPEPKAEPAPEPKPEPKAEPISPQVKEAIPEEKTQVKETVPEEKTQVKESVPEEKPAPKKETLQAPNNTADASATQYYTVQFLTATTQLKAGARELNGVSDFQTTRKGKILAYTTGRFRTKQEADAYCAHLKRTTSFSDAWVFLYTAPATQPAQDTPSAAPQQKAEAKPAAKPAANSGVSYRVQFCSANNVYKAGAPELGGIKDIHTSTNGQITVYSAGDYSTLREAKQRCNTIKKSTKFKDAFVIAIYKGERIPLSQAAEIEKKSH